MYEFAIPKPGGEGREPRAEAAAARTPAAVGGSTVASQSARLAKALARPRVVSITLRLGGGSCLCGRPIRIGEQGTSPNTCKPRSLRWPHCWVAIRVGGWVTRNEFTISVEVREQEIAQPVA